MGLGKLEIEIVNLSAAVWIMRALQAGLVTHAARSCFESESRKPWFFTNPANSVVYAALDALERDSLLHVHDIIQCEVENMTGESELRRTTELLQHRVAVAHPDRRHWSKSVMQDFKVQRRDLSDLRAGIVWDLQRSVNEAAERFGIPPQNSDIIVSMELAAALRLILEASMKPEFGRNLPTTAGLFEELSDLRRPYIQMLERYPDGNTRVDTTKAPTGKLA